ncbi:ATP-binding protein [Nonomuraea insulae]|uniref:ATP-binding protein n=1 Tax=Nonomuraea insulae TaxID=1616787 RepID=A0ABW1D4E0_9ACTN
MIIWLNGTFGAGKTTTSAEVAKIVPEATVFDSEQVGSMLRHVKRLPRVTDFQHWPPWRALVVQTATQLLDYFGGVLVIPQTVLIEQYWTEIRTGLEKAGIPLHHFLLHADRDTLIHRIENDTIVNERDSVVNDAGSWRMNHLPAYEEALLWLRRETREIDTTDIPPREVASLVASKVVTN